MLKGVKVEDLAPPFLKVDLAPPFLKVEDLAQPFLKVDYLSFVFQTLSHSAQI